MTFFRNSRSPMLHKKMFLKVSLKPPGKTCAEVKNLRQGIYFDILISCWLLPLPVKIDAVTLEVNVANYSQDTMKKAVLTRIDGTAIYTSFSTEEYFRCLLRRNTIDRR